MPAVRTVLVSGAGIAGPTLAHWLHHHGIDATVVEKAPVPRNGGYAIDLRGVALDVAERTGVLDQIRAASTQMHRGTLLGRDGNSTLRFTPSLGSSHGRSTEILRGDLVHLLHTATTAHTEYLYDDSIVDIAQEPDRVRVTFQRSRPREFDLVVGADGLHSHTRELAFGPEGPLRHDLGGHLSIFTAPDHLGLDREVLLYNTPGKLIGMYQTPRADGVKVILGLHSSAEDTIDREPVAQQRAFLKERFVDNGWETDTLLDAMDHASDFYFDSMTQIRMEDWSTGRVTLLGDAGHCASPLSGQGTSLAMVGAYVLAQELARHERVTPALQAYRVRMLPYVRANQAIAHTGLKFLAPRTQLGITARNVLVKYAAPISALNVFDTKLMKAAEAIDLDVPTPIRP